MGRRSFCLAALALLSATARAAPPAERTPFRALSGGPASAPLCAGEYADSMLALSSRVRELDRQAYSHCIRSSAVYECLSYGPEGNVRRMRKSVQAHGTGFAYRHHGGSTLLLTNLHVAEWPLVSDEAHPVSGVPPGCKRVQDAVEVVDNESDNYEKDDIELARVASEPTLDAAILRAKLSLPILPWRMGSSAALKERNVVTVRGFPLGVFQATNDGKVVSAYDRDTDKGWDHDDFVIDALLSQGSSGSPVLAISCKTGLLELVGMYHASYTSANALNLVVGVDQLKDFMATLKRRPRVNADATALDAGVRGRMRAAGLAPHEELFPFAGLVGLARARPDGTLVYSLFDKSFPLDVRPLLALEDAPAPEDFGQLGRVWVSTGSGLTQRERADLDGETLAQLSRLLEALRVVAVASFDDRSARAAPATSREQSAERDRRQRALARLSESKGEQAQLALELAERLGSKRGLGVPLSAVLSSSTAVPTALLIPGQP